MTSDHELDAKIRQGFRWLIDHVLTRDIATCEEERERLRKHIQELEVSIAVRRALRTRLVGGFATPAEWHEAAALLMHVSRADLEVMARDLSLGKFAVRAVVDHD